MIKSSKQVFHTILISLYPILGLYGINVAEAKTTEIFRPLFISLLISTILLVVLALVLKDWSRPALMVSLGLLIFYSYGHIYNYLKSISFGDFVVGRHRFLIPVAIALLLLGTMWIIRQLKDDAEINNTLNLAMVSIMIFPIFQIVDFRISNPSSLIIQESVADNSNDNFESLLDYQPDVYFIILDSYTRADTLFTIYGYNNEPFLSDLKEMGFFVADCSQSNYSNTRTSLASALSMEFIQNIWQDSFLKSDFGHFLRNSKFRALLESQGYKTVALESGTPWTEITNADIYISQTKNLPNQNGKMSSFGWLTNFEVLLLETTILSSLNDFQFLRNIIDLNESKQDNRRRTILFELATLSKVPSIKGAKFVFTHIMSPHQPFIFSAKGEFIEDPYIENPNEETFQLGYTNQIAYLNSEIPPIMESLINDSDQPPIIILLGDHGANNNETPRPDYHSTILTAIYLPGEGSQYLYRDITPINILRIISKYYFGLDLGMVEDVHYNVPHETAETKNLPKTYTPIEDPAEECRSGLTP